MAGQVVGRAMLGGRSGEVSHSLPPASHCGGATTPAAPVHHHQLYCTPHRDIDHSAGLATLLPVQPSQTAFQRRQRHLEWRPPAVPAALSQGQLWGQVLPQPQHCCGAAVPTTTPPPNHNCHHTVQLCNALP